MGEFKVIIVGGSIAGLTLAHCLARAKIAHVVLEKRTQIAPQEGASIGLWPTGGQILDQLGLWDDVKRETEPLMAHNVSYPDGTGFSHDVLGRIYQRFGYGLTFVERQMLLEVLYESYPDKENVLVGKGVVEIQQSKDGASVTTADGTTYHGSLVVGADGVHSRVRSEMFRLAETNRSEARPETNGLTAEYACIFGISSPIPGLIPGEHGNVFGNGVTVLTFHGKDAVYWFVCSKMDRKYIYPIIPRFSPEDAQELCGNKYASMRLADGVTVKDLWEKRRFGSTIAMEEGLFENWSFGRVVLIGDAVRKVTVNMGQGANCAIEDAAVLATLLDQLTKSSAGNPTQAEIHSTLASFRELRYTRSRAVYNQTMFGIRLYTRDGLLKSLMGRYIMPRNIDHMADMTSTLMADGPVVGFLPLPPRVGRGWEEYSSRNKPKKENSWAGKSLALGSVILGLSLVAKYWKR